MSEGGGGLNAMDHNFMEWILLGHCSIAPDEDFVWLHLEPPGAEVFSSLK